MKKENPFITTNQHKKNEFLDISITFCEKRTIFANKL
jgi:hypothetical protein